MKVNRIEWLREARQTTSFRRMFGLGVLIVVSSSSSANERRAAEQTKNLLEEVIQLAIAPAATLDNIRSSFELLTLAVEEAERLQKVNRVA